MRGWGGSCPVDGIRVVGTRPSSKNETSLVNDCCDFNITKARLSASKTFASDHSLDSGSQRNVESAPKKLPSFLDSLRE